MAYQYVEDPSMQNAGSEYYWKVVAKEEIGTGSGGNPEDGFVDISTISKRVNIKHEVRYYIRVYKTVSGLPVQLKDNTAQVEIPSTWAATVADGVDIGDIISTNDGGTDFLFGDNNLFWVGFQGKKAGFTVTPRFRVTLKPNSPENNTPNYKEIFPAAGYDGIPRTITYTDAPIDPQIPQNIKSDAAYNGLQGLITLDICQEPNVWVALVVQEKNNSRYIYVKTYALDGTVKHQEFIGIDTKSGGPGKDNINHYEIGRQRLIRLKAKNCTDDGAEDPGEPQTPPAQDKILYNPPNHFVTRSVSHGERTVETFTRAGNIITDVVSVKSALANRNNRLGKIYQSEDGAQALNEPVNGKLNYWGFKFTYNPQTLEYGTTTDTSIDWMLNSKDVANLLGGNTQVSIELFLNRIADMTELKSAKENGDFSKSYPRPLRKEEIDGILYRGTEYDLEFLYRVLNGDPRKTSLLEYDGVSSDFGYITGTPCWFQLHNNMRYYGSMASVQVSHVMFTQQMVPMLSKVSISFIRYPSLDFATPAQQREAILNSAKNLGGTGEEAKK